MNQSLCITILALSWASIGQSQTASPKSFWISSAIPGTPEASDQGSVTLGLRFYSDVPGSITAVRFYKGTNNTGIHTGNLWSSTGTKLAEVTFSGETASGWQQANFSTPVNITANTPYVISYLAPKGRYAFNQNYSWSTADAVPLHVSGSSPGVYSYGSSASFPTGSFNATNYWIDLVFVPANSTTATSTTYWSNSTIPGTPEVTYDTSSLTLGLQFYSDVPGSVTGVRFYKGPHNLGTHIGTLWSSTRTKLAEVTFSGETASGWQ
ncbi:MAG: DUF4082 domain-containing protein, partial [Bryobacteraceae bacterium]